ncbi:MAG: hypothetical protein EKK33_18435 [Bradyrhizobiaceae bacterium]|nr:MAG: hypothetical protein EKK33_18435 [Bradyrhizobiaceae bacterium]
MAANVLNAHDYFQYDHINFKPGEQNHQVVQYETPFPGAGADAVAHDVIIEVNHDGERQATNLVQHVHSDDVNMIYHYNDHSGVFFHM